MSFSESISPLIGRWLLAWFFLSSAYERASDWDATLTLMSMSHISFAPPLLAAALLVMVLGGLSLLVGFQTRHGAMLLFAFTAITTVLMNAYWTFSDAVQRASEYDIFARNVAIAGGLLLLVGMGPGKFAVDNRGQGGRRR
ncbi:MAG TPA: DoxX family protein [Rhizomicrobium sp.]|jgi:putative oxidoreductase